MIHIFYQKSFVYLATLVMTLALLKMALDLDVFVYRTPVGFLCYLTYFGRRKKFFLVFGRKNHFPHISISLEV